MKLIIDIPDNVYEWVKNTGKFGLYRFDTAKVIQNGTPLDDVKAEIEKQKECRCFDDEDMYVYMTGLNDAIDILDNIGKAESEDKECTKAQ